MFMLVKNLRRSSGVHTGFSHRRLGGETALLLAICSVVAVLLPLPYDRGIITLTLIYAVAGIGMNVLSGYVGIISVGHAFFLAVGAYSWARLAPGSPWAAVGIALLICLVAALSIGSAFLRFRGYVLTIATLAVGQATFIGARTWTSLTGGNDGISAVPGVSILGLSSGDSLLVLCIAVLIVLFWLHGALAHLPPGLAMLAVWGDEEAAASAGIRVRLTRIVAFVVSAIPVTLAGVLLAQQTGYVSPDNFIIITSVNLMAIAVIGGRGWRWAPIFGAALVIALPEYARFVGEYRILIYGVVLTSVAFFAPGGLRQIFVGIGRVVVRAKR